MISSFLGLQTSLRGLLAQQQALDVAAHNVANANTVGYTRQEASLGAADPLHLTAGATQNGTGAFLGRASTSRPTAACATPSSTSRSARRTWRSATRPRAPRRSTACRAPSASRRRPASTRCWASSTRAWSDLANHPESDSSKQAVDVGRPDAGRRLRQARRRHRRAPPTTPTPSSPASPAPRARSRRPPTSLAQLNKADRRRPSTPARAPTTCSTAATSSSTTSASTARSRSADARQRPHPGHARQPVASSTTTTADWQTPPARGLRPGGGQLGALKTLADTTVAGYRASLDAVAKTLHDDVNARLRRRAFFTGDTAATLGTAHRRDRRRRSPPARGGRRGVQQHRARPSPPCATRRRDQPVRRARAPDRRRRAGRAASAQTTAQRARRRRPGPPPERLRRLARRGDGQHDPLPARLPGRGARDVDHGRHARHAHQPRPAGWGCSHAHHQQHVAAPRPRGPAARARSAWRRAAARSPAASASTSPRTIRCGAERAMRLTDRSSDQRHPAQRRRVAQLARRHRRGLELARRSRPARAASSRCRRQRLDRHAGRHDRATRSTSSSSGQGHAQQRQRRPLHLRGTKTDTPPYSAATGDAYQGDARRVAARDRRRRAACRSTSTGDDVPRPACCRDGTARRCSTAPHLASSNDTAVAAAPTDLQAIDAGFDNLTAKRGDLGRRDDQPRRRGRRAPRRPRGITTSVLSEDPGRRHGPGAHRLLRAADRLSGRAARSARRLIQPSLLDFLR